MAKEERKLVKSVANAKLFNDGCIYLEKVRISFPHIGTPQDQEDDNGKVTKKFGVVPMLPKSTHVAAKNLVKEFIQKLIADNEAKIPAERWFLKNGDDSENESYAEHFIISASDRKRPTARNRKAEVLSPEEADELFYGGCWANVLIRPWFFDGKAKDSKKPLPKRICCSIAAIQFYEDDTPFGNAAIDDEGVFDSIDGGDDFDGDDDL